VAETINPPGAFLQLLEGRAPAELTTLMLRLPLLRLSLPRGNGEPVLVLPGFGADDRSTWLLRRFLTSLGYAAHGWEQGLNTGSGAPLVRGVIARLEQLGRRTHDKIHLVGWSRGGVIAREAARQRPDLVRQIITLGTPVRGGPGASSIGRMVAADLGASAADLIRLQAQREQGPITVPVTAIYSKSDGVVAWRATIDETNPNVEHIEVSASHIGLGINADVYRIIAQRLKSKASPAP
jgi:pimeloyl-ACP methyl ester carboxylesterase